MSDTLENTGNKFAKLKDVKKVVDRTNELKGDLDELKSPSGINIWDEEWELGNIELDGSVSPLTTRIRSKNFIPCNPSENYYFFTNGYGVFVFYYNNNYEYVGMNLGTNNNGVKNEIIKTHASAKYIKFRWNDEYGVKYKHDASINADMSEKYNPYYTANDVFSRNAVAEANKRIDVILETKPKAFDFMRFENVNAVVNGGQAIQDNIITRNGYQFCCYVDGNNKVCVAKRSVDSAIWEHVVIDAFPSDVRPDGHYYLSMGMDEEGQIHLVGNDHCSPLQYVRTAKEYDIKSFFRMDTMIGDNETEVSYPCFINKKDGSLLFFYRSGGSDETYKYIVNAFVAEPNEHRWERLSSNLIYGNHTDGYPYLNHIVVDSDGVIHVSGCWRANENYDIFYMKNDENGNASGWKKSDGTAYTLPVTRENSEKICDISSIDNGLLNQNGMCVDKNNNPHIVYFRIKDNKTNIFHLYKDGTSWIEEQVTEFDYKVEPNLTSYKGEISRPSIFYYDDRLYLIYRHNFDGLGGKLRLRDITDYPNYKEVILFDGDLGTYEASYDTNAINNDELNILVCYTRTDINESIPIDIRYNEIDWAKKPICGVISINLTRIDEVMNNECKVPLVMPITSGSSIIVKGGSKHFIKLCVCRNSKEEAKASAIMIENGAEKVLGSVYLYSSDSEMVKESNFLLLENNSDCIVKIKNDTSNIEFAYIVDAELIF